jgi:hypothetical protein
MPHELEKVNWGVIPIYNYNGVLVTKKTMGYYVFGISVNTPEEVDEVIQNSCSILNESIVVKDKGNWGVSNTEK